MAESKKHGLSLTAKILIGVAILVVLFLIGMIPKIMNNRRLNAQAKTMANSAPIVQAARPRLTAPDSVVLPGNIEAIKETSVQSRTTGYVAKLHVDIGSHVTAGEDLADVESPDVDQQLAQAQAQTSQSQATVGQSVAQTQSLAASVLGSQAEVHHQEAALIQAKAALAGSRSAKEQAESNLMGARARVAQSVHQVEVQRQALSQAQASYNFDLANVRRYAQLLEGGYVAQQDYDQALTTYKNGTSAVTSAKASVESARADQAANEEAVRAAMQAVQAAQASEDSAGANVTAAKSIVSSSIQSLQAARANLGAGQQLVHANIEAVQSNMANSRRYAVLQSFEHIIAPFGGIITARNVDVGSLVSPGTISAADATNTTPSTGLLGIARTDILRIYVNLPQSDYAWAPRGRPVKISIREMPNRSFLGTVHQTSGALDSTTRTLLTEVRIPNPKGELLPGMYAEAEFSPGDEKELRVPSGAIVVDAEGTKVVVVDQTNHIHYRKVTLGRDYGTEAAVLSGLSANETIAGNATDNWTDGQLVQVVQPKQTSTRGQAGQAVKSGKGAQ